MLRKGGNKRGGVMKNCFVTHFLKAVGALPHSVSVETSVVFITHKLSEDWKWGEREREAETEIATF